MGLNYNLFFSFLFFKWILTPLSPQRKHFYKQPLIPCQNDPAISNSLNDWQQPHRYLRLLNLILSLKCFHPTWSRQRPSYSTSNLCKGYITLVNLALCKIYVQRLWWMWVQMSRTHSPTVHVESGFCNQRENTHSVSTPSTTCLQFLIFYN